MWKRKRAVKCYGHVIHTSVNVKNQKTLGKIKMRADVDAGVDWLSLFRRICEISSPKFAMLHVFSEQEVIDAEFKSPEHNFQNGPSGWALEGHVPNLAWANFLGDEFGSEVDVNALARSGFQVETLANGQLFTLTDNLFDVVDRFPQFSARRAALKASG